MVSTHRPINGPRVHELVPHCDFASTGLHLRETTVAEILPYVPRTLVESLSLKEGHGGRGGGIIVDTCPQEVFSIHYNAFLNVNVPGGETPLHLVGKGQGAVDFLESLARELDSHTDGTANWVRSMENLMLIVTGPDDYCSRRLAQELIAEHQVSRVCLMSSVDYKDLFPHRAAAAAAATNTTSAASDVAVGEAGAAAGAGNTTFTRSDQAGTATQKIGSNFVGSMARIVGAARGLGSRGSTSVAVTSESETASEISLPAPSPAATTDGELGVCGAGGTGRGEGECWHVDEAADPSDTKTKTLTDVSIERPPPGLGFASRVADLARSVAAGGAMENMGDKEAGEAKKEDAGEADATPRIALPQLHDPPPPRDVLWRSAAAAMQADEGMDSEDETLDSAEGLQEDGKGHGWGLVSLASAGASIGKRLLDALPDD